MNEADGGGPSGSGGNGKSGSGGDGESGSGDGGDKRRRRRRRDGATVAAPPSGAAARLRKVKGRKPSSRRWLERQLKDPYVVEAQRRGYRSRAAFKLIEIDDKHRLLRPGQRVVDLGAAPGGWCQVAAERVGERGRVVGLDLLEMDPLPGVEFLQGDMTDPETSERLRAMLDGPVDVVLSDLAPNATGHAPTDRLRIMAAVEAALDFAEEVLRPGGSFLAKTLHSGSAPDLMERLKRMFGHVHHVKPPSSRPESAEKYVLATDYRGNDKAKRFKPP